MSAFDLHKAVRTRYRAELPEVKTQFDNELEFVEPEAGEWVRLNIRPGDSVQTALSVDVRCERTTGVVIFQVFTPVGKGDKAALQLADEIKQAFNRVTSGGVVYRVPTITTVGRTGKWWQVNVTAPFQYDEVTQV